MSTMESRMAASTWDTKVHLLRRLIRFVTSNGLCLNAMAIAAFVEATQSVAADDVDVCRVAESSITSHTDRTPGSILRCDCGKVEPSAPCRKPNPVALPPGDTGVPAHGAALTSFFFCSGRQQAGGAMSKLLRGKKFFEVCENQPGIDWRDTPKSHKADPHRPDCYTLITGPSTARICDLVKRISAAGMTAHIIKQSPTA